MNQSLNVFIGGNSKGIFAFEPLSDGEGLPFPLFIHPALRILLAASLLITLIFGAKLRYKIISYIRSPETKLGPINYLIMMDQVNGLFLAASILMRISFIASPVPMSSVAGNHLCNIANLAGAVYIGGSYIWSSYIALFRVLFIKAKDWFDVDIEVKNFLIGMLVAGIAQMFPFSILLLIYDNDNSTHKLCSHLSNEDLQILDSYMDLSDPDNSANKNLKKIIIFLYSMIGITYTTMELLSYVILYSYITYHNNNNIRGILDPSVVQARHKVNAISLTGLFAGWIMEVWYLFIVGFLSLIYDKNLMREVSTILKYYEYFLIPFVQIHSSAPIKKFIKS